MTPTPNSKLPAQSKVIIVILLILFILCASALAARVIYLRYFADQGATAVVPDNLIGETGAFLTSSMNMTAAQTAESPNALISSVTHLKSDNSFSRSRYVYLSANGDTTKPQIPTQSAVIELHRSRISDIEPFSVQNMLPGDVEIMYFTLDLHHHANVEVYFNAAVTEQTKNLAEALHVKITHLENDNILYDGTFADMHSDGYSELFETTQSTKTTVTYKIEVSLPTSTGNEYQAAKLHADFEWYVKDADALDAPQTGDSTVVVIFVVILTALFALLLLLFRQKRKDNEREAT